MKETKVIENLVNKIQKSKGQIIELEGKIEMVRNKKLFLFLQNKKIKKRFNNATTFLKKLNLKRKRL
jgi:hypothetical protein